MPQVMREDRKLEARRILVSLLLIPVLSGCYATQHIAFSASTRLDEATGVTTRSGEHIEFSVTGATIRNDTLHANGIRDFVAIPTDSVSHISVRKFSGRNTAGLVVGVGVLAFLGAGLIALSNWGANIN